MERFKIKKQKLDGIITIKPIYFQDHRGYFCETWNSKNLSLLGFDELMFQDNESHSGKNVLRGLHYQWDEPMGKLIRVVKGSVLDVCVDIRKNSPTYGQYMSVVLSDENKLQLWVPPGFAHGILSLEENTIALYKCSNVYNKDGESGIDPLDRELNIDWGITHEDIILSTKDSMAQSFSKYKKDPKF